MAEEYKETLLTRQKYLENCPGCRVDQLKKLQRGFPLRQLVSLWAIVLATALPISSLFPYIYYMIRDFHIAKSEEDVAFYAGLVGSSFMWGRALTSIIWGMVADRYGRKPTIIIGTAAVVIFNTLFGLSVNFGMAVTTRFLHGSFNGLIGPVRAYSAELFPEEYQALGISTVSTAWGIGLIIGPAVGGFLAQPAEKFPNIFPKESLFGRFPYFLPCLCMSIYAMGVTVACFWIPETLHNHSRGSTGDTCDVLETEFYSIDDEEKQEKCEEPRSKENLIKNWQFMSSMVVYCIFSFHDMAYTEIFSIWAESPRQYGGLGYSTDAVGQVLSITGILLFVYQFSTYQYLVRILGPIKMTRIAGVLSILVLTCYPFLTMLSGFTLLLLLNFASGAKNILSLSIVTGLLLLQNRAVDQHQRGAANGISMTAMSVFKAVGPACAGAIFSWAQRRQDAAFLPGDHMVFFTLNVVVAIGLIFTFKPFLAQGTNQIR